jgi:hypothetical protein
LRARIAGPEDACVLDGRDHFVGEKGVGLIDRLAHVLLHPLLLRAAAGPALIEPLFFLRHGDPAALDAAQKALLHGFFDVDGVDGAGLSARMHVLGQVVEKALAVVGG